VQREWVEPISQLYDPTAKYFINAMRMAAPESSDEQLYWAYHFLLSALVFTGSDNRRIDALSHGQYHSADFDQAYPYLIMFVSSGIRGILYESGASKHQFETPSARATIDPR
jgi:hypothetical protein